ncbi:MAG: hypothetical protein JW909_01390 [Planctomycetes bacterium]|nr:hypothetical protein [Planctomycetota bacterium]
MAELNRWLDKLENSLDPDFERRKLSEWKRLLNFESFSTGFRMNDSEGGDAPGEWPSVLVNDAIRSMEQMLLQQLAPVYRASCARTRHVPCIRANYGTGILSSVFGAEMFWMDESLDTLPTTRPFQDPSAIDRMLDAGIPDLLTGLGASVFQTAEYFIEMLAPYPLLKEFVWIYHPDLQGPVDILELLWGSEMYIAFYSEPEKIKAALALITDTYAAFMREWMKIVPERDTGYFAHWHRLFKGHVMLRDDSIVNLSPAMYAEFVKPYDERLLKEFGSGAIHSCGHIDHCIDLMTRSDSLTAFNMSQPEMNDMNKIFAATVGKGILLDTPYDPATMAGLDLSRGILLEQ